MKNLKLLPCILIIFSFVSCSSDNLTFTYYLTSAVDSLDPQTTTDVNAEIIISSIFEGLCTLDENGNATPGVAENWVSSNNNTTYTFYLREDALWSNGESVTAHDFVYAFQRAVDPNTNAQNLEEILLIQNAELINSGEAELSELGVIAISDYVLVVYLEESVENFPEMTAGVRFMPCNETYFLSTSGKYGLETKYLITNGPFTFSSSGYLKNDVYLTKSSTYTGDISVNPTYINFISDWNESVTNDLANSLENDLVDIIPLTSSEALSLENIGIDVLSIQSGTTGILFNTDSDTLSSTSIRELLVKTIDRDSLLSALPDNYESTDNIMPDSIIWYGEIYNELTNSDLLPEYDLSILSSLSSVLSSLNISEIPSLTVLCLDDQTSIDLANKIIISWNNNFNTFFNIEPVSESTLESRVSKGNYDIVIYTVTTSNTSPHSFLSNFDSLADPTILSSDTYDSMLRDYGTELYDYMVLEEYLYNNYIFYPIYKNYSYYGFSSSTDDLIFYMNYVDFRDASK